MKRTNIIIASVLLSLLPALPLKAQQINPITQAMLDGYEELLRQNPDDWFTLYERASQYYRLSDYERALADILHAVSCTPAKEKDQLASEHSLAADIYTQTGEYDKALEQINLALEATPGSYPLLYMKGNILLYLKNTPEARKCFQAMQRLKSRSQEAMFGLARCAVAEGSYDEARTYMDQAEKADPSNYITYCRLGDLYADMDENQNAAANYLSAFSLNSRDDRSLTYLFDLGRKDYVSVAEALDYALGKTSNVVPLLFLKGNIAKETGHTADAYKAYSQLLRTPEGGSPEALATMAEICRDSNSLTEALGYADRALSLSASPKNLLLKASISRDLGSFGEAVTLADRVLATETENTEALLVKAESLMGSKDYDAAVKALDAAVMSAPTDFRPLLLRGYIGVNALSAAAPGIADFQRASRLEAQTQQQTVYKGIAQQLAGKELDAADTMKKILDDAARNGGAAYLAALYYASTGNTEKGAEMLANSRKFGFDNTYLLETFSVPMLSVAPLR